MRKVQKFVADEGLDNDGVLAKKWNSLGDRLIIIKKILRNFPHPDSKKQLKYEALMEVAPFQDEETRQKEYFKTLSLV